jgi:hypothetical protein
MHNVAHLEARFLIASKGVTFDTAARELNISKIYLSKILAGDRTNPFQRNRIELWLGRPLWSTSEEWAVVNSCVTSQPELLEKSNKQLAAMCRDRGIVNLPPDASRHDLLVALLNQRSTEQTTAPTK